MPQKDKGFTESFKETVTSIKKTAQDEGLMNRKPDIAVLVLLLAGIIVSFFNIQWGAILVGVVVGITFSQQIVDFFKGLSGYIKRGGLKETLVIIGLLIFLIIALPAGVIAALVTLLIRAMLPESNPLQ